MADCFRNLVHVVQGVLLVVTAEIPRKGNRVRIDLYHDAPRYVKHLAYALNRQISTEAAIHIAVQPLIALAVIRLNISRLRLRIQLLIAQHFWNRAARQHG